MRLIRNSAKAVIIRDGSLLLIRNLDKDGDWFSLPGGGQNHGETLQEALQRECQEEIGVRVQVGELRLIREYIGKNHEFAQHDGEVHQVEFMFECRIAPSANPVTGKTPDTQQAGIAWVALSKLPKCNLYPKVLREILKNGLSGVTTVYLGNVN
jgi:ADP-ribose pyrophosphatase YjhB (NUDIX family)